MQSIRYKFIELILIFIAIPVSYNFNYSPILKLIIGVFGFIYVTYVLLKVEKNKFSINKNLNWKTFWKSTLIKLLIIAIITSVFVWFTDSKSLFIVVINKPKLWIIILLFYALFSVYPQELIYRTFFFQRYKNLFKNEFIFILINAALFSLAHIFFKSSLVLDSYFYWRYSFCLHISKNKIYTFGFYRTCYLWLLVVYSWHGNYA